MNQNDERTTEQSNAEERLTTADLAGRREDADDRNSSQASDGEAEALFPAAEAQDFRMRWDSIQAGFVDEPRKAVESADSLVAAAMKRLAETFAEERQALEAQWDRGDDVSTEDLRLALRRYRSFFGRLLSM
jgi:hypothetical protein